jgi:hypothetical protein
MDHNMDRILVDLEGSAGIGRASSWVVEGNTASVVIHGFQASTGGHPVEEAVAVAGSTVVDRMLTAAVANKDTDTEGGTDNCMVQVASCGEEKRQEDLALLQPDPYYRHHVFLDWESLGHFPDSMEAFLT